MSYVVRHRMSWDERQVDTGEMERRVAGRMRTSPEHAGDIIAGAVREDWRNREEDLRSLSAEMPGLAVAVDCEGEDGERWVEYYLDGKSCSVDYGPPELDPSMLE